MKELVSSKQLIHFLKKEIDSEKELFERLFAHFTNHLLELEKNQRDLESCQHSAHKIRSGCRSFGALILEEKLETLEAYDLNENQIQAREQVQSIISLSQPTLTEIRKISSEFFLSAGQCA